MALGQYHLFFVMSAALLLLNGVSVAAAAPEGEIPGGWTPIKNISDRHVQYLGEYAVTAHNEEKGTSLKFEKVISGETQLVSGAVNYRLDIEALEDDIVKPPMNKYQAVVYEKIELVSFKPLLD